MALKDLLNPSKRPLFGLDISSSAVKMVELTQSGKQGYRVERYAMELLPRNAMENGAVTDIDVVAERVQRCYKKLGGGIKYVAMALPSSAVITKKIIMAANLSEVEMEQQVEAEANQYIPYQIDEVNLDFQVIGPTDAEGEVEVMLAAAKKELVEDRVACAEAAGLRPLKMDAEFNAVQGAFTLIAQQFPENGAGKIFVLLDVGTSSTTMTVYLDDEIIYTRDQEFGGSELTTAIVNQYGMSLEEAEIGKRSGDLPENYETEVVDPYLDRLSQEMGRALQFFFSSTTFTSADYILMAGGGASLEGTLEAVESRLQVKTLYANPFKGMQVSSHVKSGRLEEDSHALLVACGLAMRRFYKQ